VVLAIAAAVGYRVSLYSATSAYDDDRRPTLRVGAGPATVVDDPNGAERALWARVVR